MLDRKTAHDLIVSDIEALVADAIRQSHEKVPEIAERLQKDREIAILKEKRETALQKQRSLQAKLNNAREYENLYKTLKDFNESIGIDGGRGFTWDVDFERFLAALGPEALQDLRAALEKHDNSVVVDLINRSAS